MKGKSIMIQGTASTVGKSIIATALCRIFKEDNIKVVPFKSQNMSLNSGVTPEGDEIGRAQIMQAEAAEVVPTAKMNPILLKPTSDRKSQIVLLGKVWESLDAVNYFDVKKQLKPIVKEVYEDLETEFDLVVIEGAGSPAEINLSDDFVNMAMAEIADAPVLLVADIDKGGVFASIYGTVMLLPEEQRKRIKGIIINKFRGSVELLKPGLKQIEELVQIPVVGVVPYFNLDLEDEDSVADFSKFKGNGQLKIAVIKVPYMSNFTDFNGLKLNENISISFVDLDEEINDYHLIILPGSKNTIGDLLALRTTGMDKKILEAYSNGKFIFGICGGYQMLGKKIFDENSVESEVKDVDALGLLNLETYFNKVKDTKLSKGIDMIFGTNVEGYEIHMGSTIAVDKSNYNFIVKDDGRDGYVTSDLRVYGTYFHGIFDNGEFTLKLLNHIRNAFGITLETKAVEYRIHKEEQYKLLANVVRESLDMKKIYEIIGKTN